MNNPTFNPSTPTYAVKDCPQCRPDKRFQNGEAVYNARMGIAYTAEDIVTALNSLEEREREQNNIIMRLLPVIKVCNKYNIPLEDLPSTLEEYIRLDQ